MPAHMRSRAASPRARMMYDARDEQNRRRDCLNDGNDRGARSRQADRHSRCFRSVNRRSGGCCRSSTANVGAHPRIVVRHRSPGRFERKIGVAGDDTLRIGENQRHALFANVLR